MNNVIVVEGKDDTRRLKEVFGVSIETIETNGSAIDEQTLSLIEKAHEHKGVIILTDPDFPGEKIRKMIAQRVPTAKHAFITVDEALPKYKGSLGVEHASDNALKRALKDVKVVQSLTDNQRRIDKLFLMRCSLIGSANSAKYRALLSEKLGIGHVNGKQLEKRLNMFNISPETVLFIMEQIIQDTINK